MRWSSLERNRIPDYGSLAEAVLWRLHRYSVPRCVRCAASLARIRLSGCKTSATIGCFPSSGYSIPNRWRLLRFMTEVEAVTGAVRPSGPIAPTGEVTVVDAEAPHLKRVATRAGDRRAQCRTAG